MFLNNKQDNSILINRYGELETLQNDMKKPLAGAEYVCGGIVLLYFDEHKKEPLCELNNIMVIFYDRSNIAVSAFFLFNH